MDAAHLYSYCCLGINFCLLLSVSSDLFFRFVPVIKHLMTCSCVNQVAARVKWLLVLWSRVFSKLWGNKTDYMGMTIKYWSCDHESFRNFGEIKSRLLGDDNERHQFVHIKKINCCFVNDWIIDNRNEIMKTSSILQVLEQVNDYAFGLKGGRGMSSGCCFSCPSPSCSDEVEAGGMVCDLTVRTTVKVTWL